jgi:hypothetical protein
MGRVRRLPGTTANGKNWKGRILRPSPKGDAKVFLCEGDKRRSEKVSIIVLRTFVGPPPPGTESCHWDDDKQNNKLSNLRWDTHKANGHDALRNGLMLIGEQNHTTKLTLEDVRQIRRDYTPSSGKAGRGRSNGGKPIKNSMNWLARKYGVHSSTIENIVNRKSWKHIK